MSNFGGVQDKQIRFTVGMDEASIRKGINLLREFQREAQKLAQDLNRAMGSLGGGGGRPGGGAMFVGGAGLNLAQQTGRSTPTPQAPGGGGVTGALTKQILENKQLFQAIASGSKEALRVMSGALKDEVGKQQMDIRRLRKEIEDLNREYAQMQKFKSAGRLYVGDPDSVRGQLFDKYGELGAAQSREKLLQQRYAMIHGGGGGGDGGGGGGGGAGGLGGGARRALHAMGISDGMVKAGGVAAVGYIIGKTIVNTIRSTSAEAAASPHDYITRSVKQGGAYGQAAMGIRGGDLSLMHAFSVMRGNSWFREDFGRLAEGAEGIYGRGSILPSGFEKGRMGGLEFNRSNHRLWDIIWRNAKRGVFGLDPAGAINDTVRSRDNIPVEQATAMLDYAQKMEQANPLAFAGVRHFQEHAGATISHMRGLGSGTKLVRNPWSTSGNMFLEGLSYLRGGDPTEKINYASRTMRKYQNRAISPEEVLAGQHAVESIAGYHAGQSLRHQAIYGNLGGHLPNAALMAGTGALVGNAGLWNQFTGAIGGNGGMDRGAASTMAATLHGGLLGGNPITSGQGLLGALYQYGRGSTGAQDMLLQRFMPQGLSAMGQVTGGGIDAYQSGSNLLNAIQAMPNGSVMAQEYLAQLDPATIAEVMATGKVPQELAARGIGPEAVKAFAQKTFARAYDRNIGMSPGQDGQMNDVQKQAKIVNEQYGGDFGRFLREAPERLGLKGDALKSFQNRAFVNQGAFYHDIGWAGSDMAGQSLARIQAGLGTDGSYVNGKRVKGRGIGDPAAGSDQMKQLAKTSEFEGENERWIEQNTEHLQGMIGQRRQAMETLNRVGQSVGMAADQVAAKLNSLASAIEDAERRIRGRPASGNAAPKR